MQDARQGMPVGSIEQDAEAAGDASRVVVEAKLTWTGDTISVRHVEVRDSHLHVGELGLGFWLDEHCDDVVVASRSESGEVALRLPNGAIVPVGCRMKLRIGRATLQLTLVADDAVRLPRALPDGRVAFGILAAAALHLCVLGLVAHGRAGEGATEEVARQDLARMIAAAEERSAVEQRELAQPAISEKARTESGGAPASKGEAAAAGNIAKPAAAPALARVTRGEERHASVPEKPKPDDVATFGILALLASDGEGGQRAGSSAFAAETGPSAIGNIFGQNIADAAGLGALGLSGTGQGGGGSGAGVTLGTIGTVGNANGNASGIGYGNGHCLGCLADKPHVPRSWWVSDGGDALHVSGRLPPEAIQRVVRQSFGRLRGCYERGLEQHPDLEGRITVKFVIGRDGNVALASGADRTLDDTAVANCVVRAYEAMTFPQPTGGIVTVVYPVVFTRTGP